MESVFKFRDQLVDEYSSFSRSFTRIAADDIRIEIEKQYAECRYWPEPLIQINPNYQRKGSVQQLVKDGILHPACADIFQTGKTEGNSKPLTLYAHQLEALAKAQNSQSYVVTTGTGSGKSLSFFIPVIDRILKAKETDKTPRTRAIVIYPMNALANSQLEELEKFLHDFSADKRPFTVARYTGQEREQDREAIAGNPPDILLTNFMMLELILTRYEDVDRRVVEHCRGLEFLILDELHTYRGRQGADVAMLVRRLRERLVAKNMVCIGTSATMSSTGTQADRNKTVAEVASRLFGARITEHDVIGETLERVTDPSKDVAAISGSLKQSVSRDNYSWKSFEEFRADPLAIWVELTLGIELPDDEAPRRASPMTLRDASKRLAKDAQCNEDLASVALQRFLIAAHDVVTTQGQTPFAFKLHQFISGPGKVHTTLEPQNIRHVTLDAQRFAPGRQAEGALLYPAHFCRDCGQEYHPVWRSEEGRVQYSPREIDDITADDNADLRFGFLCPRNHRLQYQGRLEDLPELWLDLSRAEPKIKSNYKKHIPVETQVDPQGLEGRGEEYWYIPGKFRFCLNCGQVHEAHGKDINRLASLSGEGRSSATTILTLTALRQLFSEPEPPPGLPDPRKLLGFTDNRQDAALQAGHFNDFVYLLTLRAGLIRALQDNHGLLNEENLADAVFNGLGFQSSDAAVLAEYLRTPKLMGLARQEAQRTLRFIIGYRLLRDLRRGWRFNNPNLDQLNLLSILYRGLDEFCADNELFEQSGAVLSRLSPANRAALCQIVFDEMRRGLCLETRYLDSVEQDKARNTASTYLNDRWAFAPDESLETAKYLIQVKRPEYIDRRRSDHLMSGGPRSRFLKLVKNADFWKQSSFAGQVTGWKDLELVEIVGALLQAASNYGYTSKHALDNELVGWRLNAAAMEWCLIENQEIVENSSANAFFRHMYLATSEILRLPTHPLFDFEAHEHTAQVDPMRRQLLEQRFRYTEKDRQDWAANPAYETPLERLPVMFCSPTMELGVDISALNTVYLRNVPPTPANYAQRSGRAGRSGQQALVITYCAALSPHDQWFFHHATDMVHGIVKPPSLDLANRDLIESHLHAVWLACAEVQLDSSIAPLLDLDQDGKPVKTELIEKLSDPQVLERARQSADAVIAQVVNELNGSPWFTSDYVHKTIARSPDAFSQALERWRVMFDATQKQMSMADQIVKSHTASHAERQNASRRYGDAARQYAILLKTGNTQNSDFYTYRYLASQGFLPGYNFPRLPLMAWIPATGGKSVGDDEGSMVSRPRFLALSEFGPRSLIYHQGRMYRVVRAKLNVGAADHVTANSLLSTVSSLICSQCGYGHLGEPGGAEPSVNCCENCGALLTEHDWVKELYRIETVETVPVERISINEEDRQRQGFDLQTTYRFTPGPDGITHKHLSEVRDGETVLAGLTYSPAARLWRINRGWRRRKEKKLLGFYINPIIGTWSKQDDPNADENGDKPDETMLDKVPPQRIVPFVEDHRNLLILAPVTPLSLEAMATLQSALKRGVEMTFQIEESELVAEPLPTIYDRKALLFYESAEGGAGVLTRLANEPQSLAQVANAALRLMHFREPDGAWAADDLDALELRDPQGNSVCEAGCYQCLLSYYNQPDHTNINRRNRDVLDLLVALANSQVKPVSGQPATRPIPGAASHDDQLSKWLDTLADKGLRQPDATQVSVSQGAATAAAQYKSSRTLVFLTTIEDSIRNELIDKGWQVLDFSRTEQWPALFDQYAEIFGNPGRN